MNKPEVAIAKCVNYEKRTVAAAMQEVFDSLGGLDKFVAPGSRVFVKPNLLMASAPEKACTTHPQVLIDIIGRLQDMDCEVAFGDLPGSFYVANTKRVLRVSEMERVAGETGAEMVVLESHGFKEVDVPDGVKMKLLHVPEYLDGFDTIVNVCKVKTHMQSLFTGAVKNMFGLVTTQDRIVAHRNSKYMDFAEALVDIFSVFQPALNVADGVVGMEGTGPSQGTPVKLNFLAASADAVALDSVAATLMGIKPREVGTIEAARKRGLGAGRMWDIELKGGPVGRFTKKVKRPSTAVFRLLPVVSGAMTEMTTIRPKINGDRCKKCDTCVAACPNDAIRTSGKHYWIDDARCLVCFCCHELCPHDAVELKKPLLVKMAELLKVD